MRGRQDLLSLGALVFAAHLAVACGTIEVNENDTVIAPDADVVAPQTCETDNDCVADKTCRVGTCDVASGVCTFTTQADTCYIGNECYNRDQEQPGDGCKVCNPDLNANDFVNKLCPDDGVCNQTTGECESTVVTASTCGLCDTSDDCDAGLTCQLVGASMRCTQSCTATADCESGYECLDVNGASLCVLAAGTCAADGGPCNASADCDDQNPCTVGTCDGSVCTIANDDAVTEACYTGDPATQDVGACVSGTRACAGGVLGDCVGDVLPAETDACGDNVDNDCDGTVDQDCNFVGVDFTPMNAVSSGEIGSTGDILFVTFDTSPVGPASPADAPIKVDLGVYPTQF